MKKTVPSVLRHETNEQPSIRKRLSEATAQQIATNFQKLQSIIEISFVVWATEYSYPFAWGGVRGGVRNMAISCCLSKSRSKQQWKGTRRIRQLQTDTSSRVPIRTLPHSKAPIDIGIQVHQPTSLMKSKTELTACL